MSTASPVAECVLDSENKKKKNIEKPTENVAYFPSGKIISSEIEIGQVRDYGAIRILSNLNHATPFCTFRFILMKDDIIPRLLYFLKSRSCQLLLY